MKAVSLTNNDDTFTLSWLTASSLILSVVIAPSDIISSVCGFQIEATEPRESIGLASRALPFFLIEAHTLI